MKQIGRVFGSLEAGKTKEDFLNALVGFYVRANPWEDNPISFEIGKATDARSISVMSNRNLAWAELMQVRRHLEDFCRAAVAFSLMMPGIRFTLIEWGDSEDFV